MGKHSMSVCEVLTLLVYTRIISDLYVHVHVLLYVYLYALVSRTLLYTYVYVIECCCFNVNLHICERACKI